MPIDADLGDLDYARHYMRWHDLSDSHFIEQTQYWARKLDPLLPKDRAVKIVEIGCGMGFALAGLRQLGFESAEGIDANKGQIDKSSARGLNARYVPVSETASFLQSVQADVILAFDVLEHVPIPEQLNFLGSIREALKPGGMFICQVPNADSYVAPRLRYIDWTHHCSFTEPSLDLVLHNAGFREIRIMEEDPNLAPWMPFLVRRSVLRWALRSLGRWLHGKMMEVEIGPDAKRLIRSANMIGVAKV